MEVEDTTPLDLAQALEVTAPDKALKAYREIISLGINTPPESDEDSKQIEKAICRAGYMLAEAGQVGEIVKLSKEIRPLFEFLAKIKTAKIVFWKKSF